MIIVFLILIIGLTPSLVSLLVMRRADARAQARLELALEAIAQRRFQDFSQVPDQHYIEGIGYVIGDITCQFNARSSYVRCAVNPTGPCQSCRHYESTL